MPGRRKDPWLLGAGVRGAGQRQEGNLHLTDVPAVALADDFRRSIGQSTAPVLGQWSARAAVIGEFGGFQIKAQSSPIFVLGWWSNVDLTLGSTTQPLIADMRTDQSRFQLPGLVPGYGDALGFYFPGALNADTYSPLMWEFSNATGGGPGTGARWAAGNTVLVEPLVIEPGLQLFWSTWTVNTAFEVTVIFRKQMHPPLGFDV